MHGAIIQPISKYGGKENIAMKKMSFAMDMMMQMYMCRRYMCMFKVAIKSKLFSNPKPCAA